jgi:excisionase family DNA binding protein
MPNTTPVEPTLLTAEELAAVLRVHVETVRRWSREKKIPSLSVGKDRRYDLAEVKAAISSPVTERSA